VARHTKALVFTVLLVVAAAAVYVGWRASRPAAPAQGQTTAGTGDPQPGGELIASLRSEPVSYNRYIDNTAPADLVALLTQARLVRVNRATDEIEPWLAESWVPSPDGSTYTLKLRDGLRFSDGVPMTSADVLFSFRAVYDPDVESFLAPTLKVDKKPLEVSAPDASTVVVRWPAPFPPGLRMLDNLPILPRHKLEAALAEGRFRDAWRVGTPVGDVLSLGPFVLAEHVSGQRLVFTRNPHYWRKDAQGRQLPYLEKLTVTITPDQNTEALRMESGEQDLMANGDIRPEDYPRFRQVAENGRVRLIDGGTTIDPNLLWFNLSPSRATDPRAKWLQSRELRQAISCTVDRTAVANAVFRGEAVPLYGPITPSNRTWYAPPSNPCDRDLARAKQELAKVGLQDRNGDGLLEDERGAAARFSILSQSGHTIRVRTVAIVQEQLRQIGLTVDTVAADPTSIFTRYKAGDYDAIYFGVQATSKDPALNPEFWFSSGPYHFWHPSQKTPASEWERQTDDLMHRMSASADLAERQRLFGEVLRIFDRELPAIYFVAPKVTIAVSSRVLNPQPAVQVPQLLWSADTLAAAQR
jgi:peptide/nickel transport system substrate-binding protein